MINMRSLSRIMRDTLTTAQEERPQRQDIVDGELDWIRYERATMHNAVNQVRENYGLPLVPLAAVERVEQMACGHSDYTHKFAWYCAELALGEQPCTP